MVLKFGLLLFEIHGRKDVKSFVIHIEFATFFGP